MLPSYCFTRPAWQVLVECNLAGCSDFATTMHSLVIECCSYLMRGPPLAPECYCTVHELSDFERVGSAADAARGGELLLRGRRVGSRATVVLLSDERGMRFEKYRCWFLARATARTFVTG